MDNFGDKNKKSSFSGAFFKFSHIFSKLLRHGQRDTEGAKQLTNVIRSIYFHNFYWSLIANKQLTFSKTPRRESENSIVLVCNFFEKSNNFNMNIFTYMCIQMIEYFSSLFINRNSIRSIFSTQIWKNSWRKIFTG